LIIDDSTTTMKVQNKQTTFKKIERWNKRNQIKETNNKNKQINKQINKQTNKQTNKQINKRNKENVENER
jgi:hypothetical protein